MRGAVPSGLVTLGLASILAGRSAAAQSFVEEVSDDPCATSRALEPGDMSPTAQHLRRACRLQRFEGQLAADRREEQADESRLRETRIAAWAEKTQPVRVLRPIAAEGYLGTGVTNYGLTASWDVLRRLELAVRIGWRKMTCWNEFSPDGGDCTRRSIGGGVRWLLLDTNVTPFIAAGFAFTGAHLQVLQASQDGGNKLLSGNGRAHSVNAGAGFQVALRGGLRASIEYVYEHVYYTGASQDDMNMTPSPDLDTIWHDSLAQDRHGMRFQVGYAF